MFGAAEKISKGTLGTPTHAPAQLIKLRQPKGIRTIHNERVGIRDIQPGFNDRSAKQHIKLPIREGMHHFCQLIFGHLPMRNGNAGFGH